VSHARVRTVEHRGWEIVRIISSHLEIDVVPGKGADILAVRWLPLDLNVLWTSPWGLRPRHAAPPGGDSLTNFLAHYPGGWQTIFPNGGDAVVENGVELGFHGEASLACWDWEVAGGETDAAEVRMETTLSRTPFALEKRLSLKGRVLRVDETVRNLGRVPLEVMWSHHPAFGAPFIAGARVETAAGRFIADDQRDVPDGDLRPGASGRWPQGITRDGSSADLRRLPDQDASLDRFGYLTEFEEGRASIINDPLSLECVLRWDVETFPHAWFWLEVHATAGYPWYRQAHVFAIEPASSYPGQGIAAVRQKTGTQMLFEPGESRSSWVELELSDEPGRD
jgi:galactose mutarotase-like enzyme